MARIIVDISDIDDLLEKVKEQIGGAVDETLEYAQEQWAGNVRNRALKEMIMSKSAIHKTSEYSGEVVLDDTQAEEMLGYEIQGHAGWDMKPGLLASPKAKTSKTTGVRYLKVPFHGNIPGRNPFTGRHASTSEMEDYEDMLYEAGEGGTYRTVSDKSPPGSWMYPPQNPNPDANPELISSDVEAHLLEIIEDIFR